MRLAFEQRLGAWHLSSADEIAYAQAAHRMAEICGFPAELVRGEDVSDAQVAPIHRHRYAALNAGKLAAALGFPIRPAASVLQQLFSAYPRATSA